MTASLAIACIATGSMAGCVLRSVFVSAEISRVQAQMQRKIRHWQCETARARSRAEWLARQLAAHTGEIPEEQTWSPEDDE